jgi:hypothetical protein
MPAYIHLVFVVILPRNFGSCIGIFRDTRERRTAWMTVASQPWMFGGSRRRPLVPDAQDMGYAAGKLAR